MNTYKIKQWIKPVYAFWVKCWVPFCLPFVSKKGNVPLEQARQILEAFSPDSHGTVDTDNQITPEYDVHIIIPCYNVEKYVEECLNSVFSQQTECSYFVTIVNDGSTDNTLSRIQHVLANLPESPRRRVELIDQPNKGFSGARNTGLKHIRGKYVMFVDSDDLLLPNAVEILHKTAITKNVSIVVAGHESITVQKQHLSSYLPTPSQIHGGPVAKLFTSECFAHIQFPEGYLFEDSIMACCLFSRYSLFCLRQIVYQYRQNPTGITHNHQKLKKSIDVYYLFPYLWSWMIKHNLITPASLQTVLTQAALAYMRTFRIGEEKILMAGFSLLADALQHLGTNIYSSLPYKYKQMYRAMQTNDFGKYALLSKYWRFL